MDPPVITVNNDHFKVVFLTDSRNWSSDEHVSEILQKCTASVRLSVLKLLTYFANGSAGQATHLRWGYKFFNSIDVPPCKRETLKEFTESNVETFEEQLLTEFETGIHMPRRPKTLPKSEKTQKLTAGLSVQHALADVLQDFQWEGPDIRSPVKATSSVRTRSRTQAKPSKENTQNATNIAKSNFVFLFMPIPPHSQNVLDFFISKQTADDTGPDVNDSETDTKDKGPSTSTDSDTPSSSKSNEEEVFSVQEFKDSIVTPEGGLQEKIKQNGITIFWIDTAALLTQHDQEAPIGDKHGIRISAEAMRQLGGDVIPISNLLTLHNQDLNIFLQSTIPGTSIGPTDLVTEEEEEEEEDNGDGMASGEQRTRRRQPVARNFFPWSSVIRQCLGGRPTSSASHWHDGDGDGEYLCTWQGGKIVPHCKLKMQPLFGSSTTMGSATASIPSQAAKPSVLPSTPPRSAHTEQQRDIPPSAINAHIDDMVLQVTKSACEEGETSTNDNDKQLLELNASPSTVKYLKIIRRYLRNHSIVIQGALPTSSLFLGVHYDDQAFMCTGVDKAEKSGQRSSGAKRKRSGDEEEEPTLKVSSWFKKLMIDLSQKKLALLVDMQDEVSGLLITGVLEPLTSVTATLKVIKPSMVRSVERLVQKFRRSENSRTGETDSDRSGVVSDKVKSRIRDVAKKCVREASRGQRSRRKSTNRVHSPAILSGLQGRAQKAMTQFNPHQLEAWYHKTPTHGVPVKFVDHLKEIPEDLSKQRDQPHPTLDQLLFDLEGMYDKQTETSKNESTITTKQEEKKLQVRKTLNIGTRTVSIMKQSINKNINKKKPPTDDKNKEPETEKPHVNKAYIEIVKRGETKFTSEKEFVKHLQTSYNKCLTGELDSLTWVFKTMRPILLYAKSKCSKQEFTDLTEELVNHVRNNANKALLINAAQLRKRYMNMNTPESYEQRVREVQMQVLLRLEMEALLPTVIEMPEKDKKKEDEESQENVLDESMSEEILLPDHLQENVDEMVTMLQSIPIWLDHSRLATFLEDVVSNYHKILGPILKVIYNDLMLAKPEELMSPSRKPKSTVKNPKSMEAPSSYGSIVMPSVSAGQRSKTLVRHPSFDVGSKRVIPVVIKKEAAKKPKEKKKKKKEQEDDQAKRVCRNLFSGGGEATLRRSPRKKANLFPRRQSVAVMESSSKELPVTRWTSPRRRTPGKSPARLVLKTRIVKETPGKKQVLQAMLNKQERARKQTTADKRDEHAIVEESPDKVVKETPHPKRRTPGKSRPKLTRHHSHRSVFYSKKASKSTSIQNMKAKEELHKDMNIAARIAGKTPEAKPVGRRLLHTRAQSTSGAAHVFGNFASPATLLNAKKMQAVKTEPEDSPSKNTRSHVNVVPGVLSSPKSSKSKRSPAKSPKRMVTRVLWNSPEKSLEALAVKSPVRTPKKVMVQDTPEKTVETTSPITSPIKHSPSKTPKKSPNKRVNRTPKKATLRTPRKSSSEVTTSTPIEDASTHKKRDVAPNSKLLVSENEEGLGTTQKVETTAPCEKCVAGDLHSHSSRLLSSASFLHVSEMSSRCLSTASSLEDVFDSPPRKSPARKANRTPEIVKVWKQKKPQNGASPKTGLLKSPKSSTRSDSPVFGAVASPPIPGKRPTSSPFGGKRQKVIKQSPATKGRTTSSPTFGKCSPSPGRKRALRSPSSTGKRNKGTKGQGKKAKVQKTWDAAGGSILSWLDIKGLKGDKKVERKKEDVDTLLEIADIEHKKSQEARRRKRERTEDEEEERVAKKHKSTEDDDVSTLSEVELLDIDELDLELSDDEVIFFKDESVHPVNLSEAADTSQDVNAEDIKEFLSPSRKLKMKQSPGVDKSRETESDSESRRDRRSETDTGVQCEDDTLKTKPLKHKSFRRLPTRRSLVTKMSSGNSPCTSEQTPISPMFSDDTDDSLALSSEEDIDHAYPHISEVISELQTPSGDTSKKQYTPVSKKGLVDLINSPLINSSEKLKKAVEAKEKRGISRRHVSFSSD